MYAADAQNDERGAFNLRALFHLPNSPHEICLLCIVCSPDDECCAGAGGGGAGIGGGAVE